MVGSIVTCINLGSCLGSAIPLDLDMGRHHVLNGLFFTEDRSSLRQIRWTQWTKYSLFTPHLSSCQLGNFRSTETPMVKHNNNERSPITLQNLFNMIKVVKA